MEMYLNMHFDTISYKEFITRTNESTPFLLDIFVVRSGLSVYSVHWLCNKHI